jgi:hypothetical protein
MLHNKALKVFRSGDRKLKENRTGRIRTNQGLMDPYRGTDVILEITKCRLRWLGHVQRMPEEKTVKKAFKNILEGKGPLESKERDGWTMLTMI